MKKINEHKLQAFTVGTMAGKRASRKEQEEQKKKDDERAAAHAFQEFVETFQDTPSSINKVWVKAGTYDAGSRKEDQREKGKLYKPTSKLDSDRSHDKDHSSRSDYSRDTRDSSSSSSKKRSSTGEKKKSNLELFKEELRQLQEEREERHKYKGIARTLLSSHSSSHHSSDTGDNTATQYRETDLAGSFDNGDPTTTNLYLGNLCPKISEQQLMDLFGKYGPLASIKIMWPRSEEEKSRGRNCGFVAYMSRRDAERALRSLNGRTVMGYEMKLGWGKSVPITSHPIYIPQALLDYLQPTSSNLPFNAQPPTDEIDETDLQNYMEEQEAKEAVDKVLDNSLVKVVIPTERSQLALIHRMIEFVVREGPLFEAMIMNREIDNPAYRFLFDNKCTNHVYYRWKLFSLLQGDTIMEWRQKEFRMFQGGSVWKPPVINLYGQGMPEELVTDEDAGINKGQLSQAQRDRLEDLIRHLMPERQKIGEAMIFCIEHADAADEICECIAQSIESRGTLMHKKIARLYLVSDILHNCSVKVQNASFFRKSFEAQLEGIVSDLHEYQKTIESRIKAAGFKARVMQVFQAWTEWAVYPKDFLALLKHLFLGGQASLVAPKDTTPVVHAEVDDDIDGAPLSGDDKDDEEDLDGVPLDGAALLKSALARRDFAQGPIINSPSSLGKAKNSRVNVDDIDGVPLGDYNNKDDEEEYDDDIDGVPLEEVSKGGKSVRTTGFIPSKWETIAPDQVEAQAITTSKWDTLESNNPRKRSYSDEEDESSDEDSPRGDGRNKTVKKDLSYDEDKRAKLREVEVQTIQYQDELESGARSVREGMTMSGQLEQFRKRLMNKSLAELRATGKEREDSGSERYGGSKDDNRRGSSERRRSVSPDEPRHRRRSPSPYQSKRNKRARSRSVSPGSPTDRYSSSSSSRKYRAEDSPAGGRDRRMDKYKYK